LLLLATRRSVPEICETGEQGGLIVGYDWLVHFVEHLSWLQSNLLNSIDELPTVESSFGYKVHGRFAVTFWFCEDGK
jgi:hypothetical protein